VRQKEGKRDR
jgi:hypothetical protein